VNGFVDFRRRLIPGVQSQMVSRRDLCNGFSAHGLGQIGC
jgi:hypothetical protein